MTDEEFVATMEEGIRVARARAAAFNAALERTFELDPISDVVTVNFDGDGYLHDLVIDPTALTSHTYTELEDLITEVLRDGHARLEELVMEAAERCWGSNSSWRDVKALSDHWPL